MRKTTTLTTVFLVSLLGLGACSGLDRREQRALSGGALGAGAGALIGAVTGGSAVTGALVGAAGGAAVGALTTDNGHKH